MPDSIIQWDYEAFIVKHNFGAPVASNWHVTQYSSPRDEQGNTGDLNTRRNDISVKCTRTPLQVTYDIRYYSGVVRCGNLLLESDIGGGLTIAPEVRYEHAKHDEFYTLIYVDPDATAGSWPQDTTPGSHAPVRHWVAGNIPGHALQRGDMSNATVVSAYKGPSPPAGSHRYVLWLFSQGTRRIDYVALDDDLRIQWNYEAFIAEHALGGMVASNWHVTQHMDPRNSSALMV